MNRLMTTLLIASLAMTLGTGCAGKNEKAAGTSPCQSTSNSPCPYAGKTHCDKPCGKAEFKFKTFGEDMKLAPGEAVGVQDVLADPKSFDGKYVRVAGKVATVCAKRGCWLRLSEGAHKDTLFVKFTCPVKGRLIPMNAVGQFAEVEGKVELVEVSEDYARHLKEDMGAPQEEIEKIVGPQKMLKLSSKAARIAGV